MLVAGFDIPLWIPLAGTVSTLCYFYLVRNFHIFKDAGIPGPKPYPFIGTALKTMSSSVPLVEMDLMLFKEYGKFVGTFDGTQPVLLVYDAEWLKEAFIKHFHHLTDRRVIKQGGAFDAGIFSISGEHWKSNRRLLSPEFSSGRIKKMMPAIQKCEDVFIEQLAKSNGQPVDIRGKLNLLTLDVISTTAFGLETEAQSKEHSDYAENAFKLTSGSESNSTLREKLRLTVIIIVFIFFPQWMQSFVGKFLNLGFLDQNAGNYFESMCETILEERKQGTPTHDFLQNMADRIVEVSAKDPETSVDNDGYRWSRNGLTKEEVIANAVLFLLAGFRTTADSLLYLYYELAHHPDIQQQLYEEIMEVCTTEDVTIDQVNQLKLLEYSINETMRLYPQGFRFDRMAAEDMVVKGIKVKKGTAVTAGTWVLHRDPEIWENPEDFEPGRFSPERWNTTCADAYMPFGLGNRQCIGNRLALIEMKMTIIATLKKFKVTKNDETPTRPLKFKKILGLLPEEPIMVSFEERS